MSSNRLNHLRTDAEGRLRTGTAPSSAGGAIGPEALSLLYRLASNPESSADALKLLHELQTHQVELDMQHAQLLDNENELALRFNHFQALYDHAPAGYLVLGQDGRILRANRTAGKLFGLDVGQIKDHMLTSLLSPECKPAVLAALENAGSDDTNEPVQVQALDSRSLGLISGIAPGKDAVLALVFPMSSAPAD